MSHLKTIAASGAIAKNRADWEARLRGRSLAQYYLEDILVFDTWEKGYTLKVALITIGRCVDTSCMKCGWAEVNPHTGLIPTEVNHIDGNRRNCRPENLEILCPNCHSLTPTHKGANQARVKSRRAG